MSYFLPAFTVRVLYSPDVVQRKGSFGLLLSAQRGFLLLGLGFEPFSIVELTPCCSSPGEDRSSSCAEDRRELRGVWDPPDRLEVLEDYGQWAGWWADPLTARLAAQDLHERVTRVGNEANGRYSITSYNDEDRFKTIAAMEWLTDELGWDFDPTPGDYYDPRRPARDFR